MTPDDKPLPVPFVPMPEHHVCAARIFKLLFVPVPLNECEKHPDPDYGL